MQIPQISRQKIQIFNNFYNQFFKMYYQVSLYLIVVKGEKNVRFNKRLKYSNLRYA